MLKNYKIGMDVIGESATFFAQRGYQVKLIPTCRDEINYTGQPVRRVDYYCEMNVDAPENVHEAFDEFKTKIFNRR